MTDTEPKQVADNLPLLELMMEDNQTADPVYKPTNYWQVYQSRFLPELRSLGLKDFRRRRNSVLSSFQATDLIPPMVWPNPEKLRGINNRLFRRLPGHASLISSIVKLIEYTLHFSPYCTAVVRNKFIIEHFRIKKIESPGSKPLENLSMSLIGNPEQVIEWQGNYYSEKFLEFYHHALRVSRFVDLDKAQTVVELGAGAGRQAEVLHKLYPHLTIILFDIPLQQYVAQQYLSAVFPDDVVPYEMTREYKTMPALESGKIYIIGNWQFPLLQDWAFDLFLSTDSFQEMEPEVTTNYLSIVASAARNVYLRQAVDGQSVSARLGRHGVMKQTTFDNYRSDLHSMTELDHWPTESIFGLINTVTGNAASIWTQPENSAAESNSGAKLTISTKSKGPTID